MCVRVIFIWLHDLCSSIAHSRRLTNAALAHRQARTDNTIRVDASALLLFRTFLEKYFAEDILLLAKGVVVLDIVVVGLVKHAIRIVVAVWVLVAYSADLT